MQRHINDQDDLDPIDATAKGKRSNTSGCMTIAAPNSQPAATHLRSSTATSA
jgi:hypothetical protein